MIQTIVNLLKRIPLMRMQEIPREEAVNDVADAIVDTLTKSSLGGQKLSAEEIAVVLTRIQPQLVDWIIAQKEETSTKIKKQIEDTELAKIEAERAIAQMESTIQLLKSDSAKYAKVLTVFSENV